MTEQVTGAQSIVRSLEHAGVEVVFGIPGGAILPLYDPLFDSTTVRHILVRHEQGAGHAATGYAQATGRVGVCMATSGPGATNLVTAIADAYMDSVPMVAITGQVPRPSIGTDAFQEADICGITMPITKHNYLVQNPEDIPRVIAEAFYIASTGRPGSGSGRRAQGRAAGDHHVQLADPARPARLPADHQAARQADPRGGAHDQPQQAARPVRRWRRPEGACGRGAAPARRDHRSTGGDHVDGSRRLPGQPSPTPGHARHARHGGGSDRVAEGRSADHAGRAVRRPGHRSAVDVRAGGQGHPRRHRPCRDRQEPRRGRADRG